ncbi:esterase YbfF-like [Argiope bruennichi]|uniref:esterase YbfF-like n=1 Tax=Argiope bruennichi TaxID=94029 RepID=UPI0024941259|nr:esterase YbfF-like [Argiope bruennichi]
MTSETSFEPVDLFFTVDNPEDGDDSKKCPIIFIHGFFSTHRTWNFVRNKMANKTKRKVYSLDLRNHGESGRSEMFALKGVMVDIENFMESQHIEKAIFVAHSIGSKAVMALALEKPELVEKLVVEDMTVTNLADHDKHIKRFQLFITTCDRYIRNAPNDISESNFNKKTSAVMRNFFPEISGTSGDNIISLPLKKDKSGKLTWDLNIDAIIHYLNNDHLFYIDLSNDPKYFGKALFLFGDKTPMRMEENKDTTLKYFPNAQFFVFKGGFHTFHLEFTELFMEVVSKFIED